MKKLKFIIGLIFIAVGILTNRVILEKFISPYAIVELNYRVPIILINLCLVTLGLLIICLKKEYLSLNKLSGLYGFLAVNIFSVLLIFVFLNVSLYVARVVKDVGFYKDQIFFSYSKPLREIYPNLMGSELNLLLYETWSRPYVYEPYTQFKERPFKGKYVNVDKNGFRLTKDQGPWPPNPNNFNIFLFGGSTTFCYGLKDEETIASYLQDLFLNKKISKRKEVKVYNFGRGNYFSSQEKVLFQELISNGYKPDIAIFIDGLNDFYYCNNEPLFTDKLRRFIDYKGKKLLLEFPLLNLIRDIKKIGDVESENDSGEKKYNDEKLITSAANRYITNKKLIEVVANAFGVKTLFIWQPVPTYKYDLSYHIFSGRGFGRFLYSKYGYVYMEQYVKKNNLGSNFIWLANIQENLKKPLYVDIDHYSAQMSFTLAKEIYNFLINKVE